jgi:hypothetical protein
MGHRKKIDESLKERHGIVRLLERLKNDDITLDEIEEIGAKLRNAGKRALSPLVRRLWRERNGDLISRYTYLLDFFEEEIWLDQLIQIALRRRDLEEDGKAALLAALEGYGIDVTAPPFSTLLAGIVGPLRMTLPKLLDKGEEGLIDFVEDFLFAMPEMRLEIIRELPYVRDPRVVSVLEVLLRIDDAAIVGEAVGALGKIRMPAAVALLHDLKESPDNAIRELAAKNLRRLAFLGMETMAVEQLPDHPLPYYAACVSPLDGAGFRTLWLCRWMAGGRLASLFMQIHETRGITAAWGNSQLDVHKCAKQWEQFRLEDGAVTIAPEYAHKLAMDAVYRCGEQGQFLPPEFYVLWGIYQDGMKVPLPYTPDFSGYDPPGAPAASRMIARSAMLFDDDYFAGWFIAKSRVYDFAEEWIDLEKRTGESMRAKEMEALLARFCKEILMPEMGVIRTRLILTADLMRYTDREKELVEQTLAVALNLTNCGLPLHKHPFLKRFALESMDMAREALAEGFDLRQQTEEEWE